MITSASSPENRAPQVTPLVVLGMARLEEGGVVARLHPVPLQLVPPIPLAVHSHKATIFAAATASGREMPQAPASSDIDGLELGSKHLGLAYLLQTLELIQVQALED